MPTISKADLNNMAPKNPEISALIRLIVNADPLVAAEGESDGNPYVILSDGTAKVMFTFTKNAEGYQLTRTK